MSRENSNRLFYVTKVSESTFSLYSISTDHLILSEVSEEVISDFLFSNEPHHPALTDEYVSARCNSRAPYSSLIDNYSYDSLYSYSLSQEELDEIQSCLSLTYPRFIPHTTCEEPDLSNCIGEKTFFGSISLNNDSDKQLSFDFIDEVTLKVEKILKDSLDNPDNLIKAHKTQDILINKAANSPPELYVVGGTNDKGKSHLLEDDEWKSYKEWKYLDIDDD